MTRVITSFAVRPIAIQFALLLILTGCGRGPSSPATDQVISTPSAVEAAVEPIVPPGPVEIDATQLLAAALPAEQLAEGWVRLFDGQSLFGWFVAGQANWRVEDGIIKVDRGERSYLCTSFEMADYELQVDFRSEAKTNSGIFLRTLPQPEDVAINCLELNIAPSDNPFPTGSFVQRKKLEPRQLGDFDPAQWHTYRVRLQDKHVEVFLDGKSILEMDNFESAPSGHISLQHNEGRVEFRNVLLRPVSRTAVHLDKDWEKDWAKSVKEGAELLVEIVEEGLRLKGGLGQLQSKSEYADFMLQTRYTLAKPEVNSGVFFRCLVGGMLDGYECQVNHATIEGDPLRPADSGAGAIFRRQPARIVVGDGTKPTYLTLLAQGPQMVTWVNGIQVSDFCDKREPNENPRSGLRLEAGPIALQAHDSGTDVTFHQLDITPL